jgi:peptidyl-prolyl cis-trans isomerase SurA
MKIFSDTKVLAWVAGICLFCTSIDAQDSITTPARKFLIDQVVAIVGNEMILQSDIESEYLQVKAQGITIKGDARCSILEKLLEQKLMVNQAKIDSLEVSPSSVELQLSNRLDYFVNQIGSEKELENYFGKTMIEMREDFRDLIYEQMLVDKMQGVITDGIKITPSEVRSYYNSIPKDSIPFIEAKLEIQQIVIYPASTEEAIFAVKERLLDLRKRILDGGSFATLAVLYSEDPGSSKTGGEIGFLSKGELDPEYAKVAFSMKEGQVSKIVESAFGYHLIQLIERRGDRVNTRHILLKPKISPDAMLAAKNKLDSIAEAIRKDSLTFELASLVFSGDVDSRMNGGLCLNSKSDSPNNGTSTFAMNDFDAEDYYMIKNMNVGDISPAYNSKDKNGKVIYKIVKIKSKTAPHYANLEQDYQYIQALALRNKQQEAVAKWVTDKQATSSISINSSFNRCNLQSKGWIK